MPASLNPLTQLTTYIPMASALLGATIGGTVAWINLNRQFKEQRRKELIQERKQEIIALNSVLKELNYNYEQLKFHKIIKNRNPNEYRNSDLKNDKWIKHSDVIEYMSDLNFLIDLQKIYHHIDFETKNRNTKLRGTDVILNGIDKLTPEIEKHLKQLDNTYKNRKYMI